MVDNVDFKEIKGSLIKASVVRDLVHTLGGRIEPSVVKELDRQVKVLVLRGFERAKENNRSTLMKRDL